MPPFNTGFLIGTSATTIAASGWADDTWVTPLWAVNADSSGANIIATTFDTSDQSWVLKATGYDMAAIPNAAIIEGVECKIRGWWRTGQGTAKLGLAQLLQTTSSQLAGSNICETLAAMVTMSSNVSSIFTVGNGSNLWGCALTPAWLKDPRFGVGIGVWSTLANTDVDIAWINLNVYYTSAGTAISESPYYPIDDRGMYLGFGGGTFRGMR